MAIMPIIERMRIAFKGATVIALEYALIAGLITVSTIGAVSITISRDRLELSSASVRGATLNAGLAEIHVPSLFDGQPKS